MGGGLPTQKPNIDAEIRENTVKKAEMEKELIKVKAEVERLRQRERDRVTQANDDDQLLKGSARIRSGDSPISDQLNVHDRNRYTNDDPSKGVPNTATQRDQSDSDLNLG